MTTWTVAHQAPLFMGILQARILRGLPCPPPGDHPNPGIKPRSAVLQADSLPSEPLEKPKDRLTMVIFICQIRLEFVLFTTVQEPPIDDVCFNYLDNKFLLPLDSLVL